MKKSRKEWREHVASWESSGKSQAAYCRERKISLSSFQYYKGVFDREVVRPDFVEIGNKESERSIEFIVSEKLTVRVPLTTPASRISELAECLS